MQSGDISDLKTNLMACAANDSSIFDLVSKSMGGPAEDSFEFYFN